MNQKIIFILSMLLILISCNRTNDKSSTKQQSNEELKVEIIREEIIENPVDNFRLTDKNIIEFLYDFEKNNKENKVRIYTDFGQIDILLYNNTPYHRSNFIFLVKKKYFDGTQFYRVINNFVIQAGNSDNISVSKKRKNIGKYLLPNDFNKGYSHKRGAISLPSSSLDNPYKMASPFEFFIVQKKDGANHLDGKYTVFGEVIRGMDTVDKIASIPTDEMDWPINNIHINRVEIIYYSYPINGYLKSFGGTKTSLISLGETHLSKFR